MPTEPTTELTALAGGDVAAALEAAEPTVHVINDHGHDELLVVGYRNADHDIDYVDLEGYGDAPLRQSGTAIVHTAESFLTLVRHRMADNSPVTVYGDPDNCTLTAVLNDDRAGRAGWRDHRVVLQLVATPEWNHWVDGIGLRPQTEFAELIEAGEDEIVDPSPTVMLDIAQNFRMVVGTKVKRALRLKDGRTQLVWDESVETTAGDDADPVTIPDHLTISVRPFYGAKTTDVDLRLRYRMSREKGLTIGYVWPRHAEVRRESFATDVVETVGTQLDAKSIPLVDGQAAPARPAAR